MACSIICFKCLILFAPDWELSYHTSLQMLHKLRRWVEVRGFSCFHSTTSPTCRRLSWIEKVWGPRPPKTWWWKPPYTSPVTWGSSTYKQGGCWGVCGNLICFGSFCPNELRLVHVSAHQFNSWDFSCTSLLTSHFYKDVNSLLLFSYFSVLSTLCLNHKLLSLLFQIYEYI